MSRRAPICTDPAHDGGPPTHNSRPASYTISSLAGTANVSVETVRYYQRRGLMPEPPRPPGGIRRYGTEHVEQLRFIRRAQRVGFNLTEIEKLLDLRAPPSCRSTRDLVAAKLSELDARIRDLQLVRRSLAPWLADCDSNRGEHCCPVIERLAAAPDGSAGRTGAIQR